MYRRWFRAPGRRSIMIRPGEQRDRVTVFMAVVNDSDARLPAMAAKGREGMQAQKELMGVLFSGGGWECERVVREMMETDDFYFDMLGQVKMDSWSTGRAVLLGDAGYCASPFSGMSTTLAMTGAWSLAGAILRHRGDYVMAFAEYEEKMRPTVQRAQKLALGMPKMMHPETARGVWMFNAAMYLLQVSRLFALLMKMGAGPPAGVAPVEEYGF